MSAMLVSTVGNLTISFLASRQRTSPLDDPENHGSSGELDSYWWGKLAAENQPRCLLLTISGPSVQPLSISLPFSVENNQVVLGPQAQFEPAIVNMLPNWP